MKQKKKGRRNKGRSFKNRNTTNSTDTNSTDTNYATCFPKFIEYARINWRKARSVLQQVNRINKFSKTQGSKKDKKVNFQSPYDKLLSALGGNVDAPECDGKPIGNTTRGKVHKDTLEKLKKCDSDIEDVCKNNM